MHKITIILLLMVLCCAPTQLIGQSKTQLEKEKDKIEKEIKRLNSDLAKAKKNTRLTNSQIQALDKKIKERNRLINNINGQVKHLNVQITQTQDSIEIVHSQIDSLKQEYGKVIRILYSERNSITPEVLLLAPDEYNRAYLRNKYFREYSRYRRHQAHVIKQKEQTLQDMTLDLQRQKNEQNTLLEQEKKNKDDLAREQQQKKKSASASKQKEKTLAAQVAQKEKQKKQLQQQIQRIINEEIAKARKAEAEAAKRATAEKTNNSGSASGSSNPSAATESIALSADFASNKGRLSWPAYYKSVIREYGRYTHSSGGENMNNGIDLSTAPGAAVYAIFNGKVTRVFTCPNGTKGIIVRHGEYMSVYANLGTVMVNEGATVKTKQTIGAVYISPDGTSEFSFQLWKGQQSQNPRTWLRK